MQTLYSGTRSETFAIECGVPQGGALSPLLFNIFINDIPIHTEIDRSYGLVFADDLLYIEIYTNGEEAARRINKQLAKLQKWLNQMRLEMAIEICGYVIFRTNPLKIWSS